MVRAISNRSNEVPWRLKASWFRAMGMLNDMVIYVSHLYREGNQPADRMASRAIEDG